MSDVRKLAKIVADHSRQIKGLSGGPQAAYSSIEGGSMDSYDSDGKLRLRIGAQDDGTQGVKYVQGPPPPRPTAPVVSVDGPVVRVRWDGMLLGGHIPEDFARIDVHFALASDDLEDEAAVRGNLATSAGNETVLAATQTGTYRVGLVAMSQSRARSEMSEVVDVDVTLVDIEGALDAVVENARGGSNYYSPEPPSGTDHDPDRDLWFDTSVDAEGLVSYSPHRWDADLLEWVSVADQRTAALQDALGDFEGTVEQRFTDADTAIDGLRGSLTNLGETTLPALRQDLDATEGRLGEAEGQITDAFGQLEVIPGQISGAQQAAIDAAAQDAGTKADAARQAAQDHADLVAQGAEDDAIAAAEIRAQQLADAAQQAAEQAAQTKADAARDAAIAAARAEMGLIPRPNYGTTEPTHDAPDGSAYFQINDTARESFAWAGEPHASESIKYIDGVEVARNLSTNPSFETGVHGIQTWPQVSVSRSSATSGWYPPYGSRLMFVYYEDGRTWSARVRPANVDVTSAEGKYVAVAVSTRKSGSANVDKARVSLNFSDDSWVYGPFGGITASWDRQAVVGQIPASSTYVTPVIQVESSTEPSALNVTFGVDGVHVAIADTEAEALALIEEYFDGDTPARTVGGFDKIVAQWERRDGAWVQVPIRSEAIANLDVGKLTAGAGEIAELVSQKIAAATGQFLELDVGQLTVTEQTRLADVVAEQIAADTAQFMELEVGKLVASEGILDEAVIKQLFAEVVVSQMSFADSFIGGNAILEGSITAESGIIGSLDLGVAIVGKLHGQYVEAGSIDTEQLAFGAATGDVLSVDALNFKTAVGLDIRGSSFRAGDAVEMTEDFGIRQFGPDGALNVSLPSDGSPAEFRGDLSARTLTATGRMSIQGPGAIASGGVLELESGVVPPVAGPQITNTWDRTTFPPLTDQEAPAGLAFADGHFWRCVTTSVGLSEGGRVRIEKITPTGELVGGWDTTFRVPVDGITILNGELYVLAEGRHLDMPGSPERAVVVYDLNGVEQRRWADTLYTHGTYQQGIGNDGTNIILAKCWNDGTLRWRKWTPNGTYLETINSGRVMRSNVTQILYGEFDYADGPKRIVAQQRTDLRAFVCYDEAATAPDDVGRSWYAADFQNPVGLAWDGARFHSLTPTGDLVSYQSHETNRFIGDDEDDWWGAVTWATGSQETTAGPATRFRYLHRAQLRVQNGDVPAGVEAARFYTGRGATEPGRAALQWRVTSEQPHEPLRITSISSYSGGANPPATNTFTADTPGEIHSALGNFRVDGSGAGSWGPLEFHADGTMSGLPVTSRGTVSITPSAPPVTETVTVTLPAGRYSAAPTVVATPVSTALHQVEGVGVWNVTASSFQIGLRRTNGTTTDVAWIATGD